MCVCAAEMRACEKGLRCACCRGSSAGVLRGILGCESHQWLCVWFLKAIVQSVLRFTMGRNGYAVFIHTLLLYIQVLDVMAVKQTST